MNVAQEITFPSDDSFLYLFYVEDLEALNSRFSENMITPQLY
jgi:hypothetical protein